MLGVFEASSQTKAPGSNLELRLIPGNFSQGIPLSFTFELVNHTDHDIRVPQPAIQCQDSFDGSISLALEFQPLDGGPDRVGRGCASDKLGWPTILDRIQEWNVLRPGGSLRITKDHTDLWYDGDRPGIYEFWATYSPPAIEPSEQETLRLAHRDFPSGIATTSHLAFEKQP